MSGRASRKSAATRLTQLFTLIAIFALLWLATRLVPEFHGAGTLIGALGFLLLAGTLTSELCEVVGLPHLTGYILAGVIAGPNVLHLIDEHTVTNLGVVNTLALSLISFAGGAELRIDQIRAGARSLVWGMSIQCVVVLIATAAAFVLLARFIPFTSSLGLGAVVALGLLWGVLAVSRSPSATLAIFSEVRPAGPISRFTLAFVMSSDVVVLVLLSVVMVPARLLLEPGASVSFEDFSTLGREIVGSIAMGVTLGLLLTLYLRFIGSQLFLILVAMGYGLSEGIHYIRLDPLLTFLLAGFVVQNFSREGKKLLAAIEETSAIVFVVFFATAGAHLDIPLLRELWPLALGLALVRTVATFFAHRISTRLAGDSGTVRTWGMSGLVSQAGLTLGLSIVIENAFPAYGSGFRSLAIANVAVNEVVGPILFKYALSRCGETYAAMREGSLAEPRVSHG